MFRLVVGKNELLSKVVTVEIDLPRRSKLTYLEASGEKYERFDYKGTSREVEVKR